MRYLCFVAAVVLAIATRAAAFPKPEAEAPPGLSIRVEEKNPWTNLRLNNDPQTFQFAIVSDRTGGHRPGVFESAMPKLNLLQPEFVMSIGDLIEGAHSGDTDTEAQWRDFNGTVEKLEMPFFYVPGNHDLKNESALALWQKQFGRTYYHFVYRDVLLLVLNSEDPPNYTVGTLKPGHLSDEQLAWAEEVLRENAKVRWTFIFIHKPMWQYGPLANWSRMESLLGDRPRTAFAGHHHRYAVNRSGSHRYYTLATTGGGSSLAGPAAGQFDHIVWVTMTAEGPRMANLMLDGIWTDDPAEEAKEKAQAK
ncbi:MAG TPA: metallophosphoesterase [Pirellulales bacterium]|jgi:hypothetical protein|nr:metallophosphoesterase [Pirellulales bacterium]